MTSGPAPRAWRRKLCLDIASVMRLKALAPKDIMERLIAIGDDFASRGEMEKAQKAYSDALRCTKTNDDGTVKTETEGSWLGLLKDAAAAQETSGGGDK